MAGRGAVGEEALGGFGGISKRRDGRVRGQPYAQRIAGGTAPVLAVVAARRGGRWAAPVRARRAGADVRRSLEAAGVTTEIGTDACAVGLAIFEGWRCVSGEAGHLHTAQMMDAFRRHGRPKALRGFLEHRVLAHCEFGTVQMLPEEWEHTTPEVGGGRVLQELRRRGCDVLEGRDRRVMRLDRLLSEWTVRWQVGCRDCLLWSVFSPIAVGLVRGCWFGDVSVWTAQRYEQYMAACRPAPGLLRHLQTHVATTRPKPPGALDVGSASLRVWGPARGFVRRFTPRHVIDSLRVGSRVRRQREVKEAAVGALRWFFPRTWKAVIAGTAERREQDMPSGETLERAVVRLDFASMLWNRTASTSGGSVARYIAFDASPQHGQEFFACLERTIGRTALRTLRPRCRPEVVERGLPLAMLGTGRCGLAEKTQALIHQFWLDYGPDAAAVRRACSEVATILVDLGTEVGVPDVLDVIDEAILPSGVAARVAVEKELDRRVVRRSADGVVEPRYLFPRAFVVPGPLHAIDGCLRDALAAQAWWSGFLARVKVMAQYLRSVSNRRYLRTLLTEEETRDVGGLLEVGVDRFATWRWQTLYAVVKRLLRMEPAVTAACAHFGPLNAYKDREGQLKNFVETAMDECFWERVRYVHMVVRPMNGFASWIKGCDCHEEDRLERRAVDCPWQGCRAIGLSTRLSNVLLELRELRDRLVGEAPDWADAVVSRMLHSLKFKMAWVNEGPALVWQAHSVAGAVRLVREYDETVAAGRRPHRVLELFAAPGSVMRRDMEAHIAGLGLTRELCEELLVYAFAKIDDSWAEGAHRDASHLSKRCTAAKVPYLAASWRKSQNLALYDRLSEEEQRRFEQLLDSCVRIGRQRLSGCRRVVVRPMRRRRPAGASLGSFVYRFDESADVDWEKILGGAALRVLPTDSVSKRTAKERLMREYLESVLEDGMTYSLPAAAVVCRDEVPAGMPWMFFQVVHTGLERKKTVDGRDSRVRGMISLQMMLGWPRDAEIADGEYLLCYDGDPEAVDLLRWCSDWRMWTAELRRWSVVRSGVDGQAAVRDGRVVEAVSDWRDDGITTWMVLRGLKETGWREGDAPDGGHTATAERVWARVKDAVTARLYLRCLLGLPELLSGDFPMLPAGQCVLYYQLVLGCEGPAEIPVGRPVSDYRMLVQAMEGGELAGGLQRLRAPAVGGGGLAAIAGGVNVAGSQLVVRSRGVVRRFESLTPAEVADGPSRKRRTAVARGDGDWRELLECVREPEQAVVEESVAVGGVEAAAGMIVGVASGAEVVVEQASGSGAGAVLGEAGPSELAREERWLEGVELKVSHRAGAYERVWCKCPLHRDCRAQRKFSKRFARESGLGMDEPFCFLGVWLRDRGQFETAEEHEAYRKELAEDYGKSRSYGRDVLGLCVD